MARLGTPNLGIGTWLDNEYPGAGSQTVANTGLNGNWLLLDAAVGTQHNADGSHKPNIIKGSNLVQSGADSVVDGVTLGFNSNKMEAKDAGITYAKIQNISAPNKLLGRKTAGAGATEEISIDGNTLEIHATNGLQAKDLGVTAAKISRDNTRTKQVFTFAWTTAVGANVWAACNGRVFDGSLDGIVMSRPGTITRVEFFYIYSSMTQNDTITAAYGAAGYGFVRGDRLGGKITGSVSNYQLNLMKNSSIVVANNSARAISDGGYMTVEVEFD